MGLIGLEFNSGETKISAMPPTIASNRFPNKPEPPGRAQDCGSFNGLGRLRRRNNGYPRGRRRALILRAAEAENRNENDSQ